MSIPYYITTGKGTTLTTTVSSNSVYSLSTFTGMPVKFSVDITDLPTDYKTDYIVFNINDRILLKENNSTYTPNVPGVYKITFVAADGLGEPVKSYTTYLTAFNYISDLLVAQEGTSTEPTAPINDILINSTTDPYSTVNSSRTSIVYDTITAGSYTVVPYIVARFNSFQLCYSLSADNYPIELYCEGSNSFDYYNEKGFFSDKNLQNYPIFQFTQDQPLPQGGQRPNFLDKITTTSENIFLSYDGITGTISTKNSENSIFCGTSGYSYFYFKEDMPNTIFTEKIYLTQNLKDIPQQDFLFDEKKVEHFSGKLPIINNSSTYFYVTVNRNNPVKLGFSLNGLENYYPGALYNGSRYPLFVGLLDDKNNWLKYYPKIDIIGLNDTLSANTMKIVMLSAADTSKAVLTDSDFDVVPYSIQPYSGNAVDVDTMSSFGVCDLSASYIPNNLFSFNNFRNDVTVRYNTSLVFYATKFNESIQNTTNLFVLSAVCLFPNNILLPYRAVGGVTLGNYYPNSIGDDIMKINENFDYVQTLKSYALMPTLENQTNLWDYFFAYVGGDQYSSPNELGKRIYEKIANYNLNIADVDKANINELYSLFGEIGYNTKNYNLQFPSNLQRVLDLVSINYTRLIGQDTGYNLNYHYNFSVDSTKNQTNLGDKLTSAYIVSAGTNIVINQFFTEKYFTVTPSVIHCSTSELAAFSASNPNCVNTVFNGLSSYPLGYYQQDWNWGLPNVDWLSISQQHDFYLQIPTVLEDINLIENTVDWSNNMTSLTSLQHNSNLVTFFTVSAGLMEQYIENELRKGVGLI